MLDFSAHIARMEDCEAILEFVYAACREEGAQWFSYNFTPIFESPTSKNTFVWGREFPFEFQKLYFSGGYREINPIPHLTLEQGYVLTWRKAREMGRDDEKASRFFKFFEDMDVRDWAGFALYGPRNRDGFVSIKFDRDPEDFPEGKLTHIHTMLQGAHLRICAVMESQTPEVSLSERETQVLAWMGRGKSSANIATILDISPETVKTYTKRIYDKLQTNDRVTATVRALKMGLVEL